MKIDTLPNFLITMMLSKKKETQRHLVVKISKIETAKYFLVKIGTQLKFDPLITMVMSKK